MQQYKRSYFILTVTCLGLLLSACNTLQRIQTSELTNDFNETYRLYSKHLRWGHFKELTQFMTSEHVVPALNSIKSTKGRKVSSVTANAWILDKEATVMKGSIDIEYYLTDRGLIRSTTQQQTWRHNGETWQLDGGLPDLR